MRCECALGAPLREALRSGGVLANGNTDSAVKVAALAGPGASFSAAHGCPKTAPSWQVLRLTLGQLDALPIELVS